MTRIFRQQIVHTTTHAYLLLFSNRGRVLRLQVAIRTSTHRLAGDKVAEPLEPPAE